ncbi:MAG: energy-coupling factor ABC transporter permease [Steroidobacteraceae bacterium]|nr:energy-coupling factor ABC transporter permease [Steroidobacteraceae bacterium]
MHIPDGFLDARTLVTAAGLSAVGLAVALRAVRRNLPPRRVPLLGLAAAFVFAAQMLNFPVAAGTSGHLIGAALASVLLGPAAAVVAMTAVLLLQSLMFADGGITALGANLLNLALIAPLVAHGVYVVVRRLAGGDLRGTLLAAGFAAWCSTLAAALACAAQLASSGVVAMDTALAAMGGVHMLIGLGEAVITMMIVAVVARSRPELLAPAATIPSSTRHATLAYGASAAIGLMILLAPFASSLPDGLEHVAERLGFAGRAVAAQPAPLPDYTLLPLADASPWLATVVAGACGALVAFGVAWFVARSLAAHGRQTARR